MTVRANEGQAAPPPIRVLVDDRERAGEMLWVWEGNPEVTYEITRLTVGDYCVDDSILFERKSFRDLAASIRDGRLFDQARRLVSSGRRSALILEGTSKDVTAMNLPRHGIQGALVSLALVVGLPVIRSTGPEETARLILYAARQIRATTYDLLPYRGRRPRGRRRAQLRILQDLPGVGAHRAVRLLETFGSVETVFSADEDELCDVPGIGPDTARRIRRLVTEPRIHYGSD